MIQLRSIPYVLQFKKPAGTSRGTLLTKPGYFIIASDASKSPSIGVGEYSILPGLSKDDTSLLPAIINTLNQAESTGLSTVADLTAQHPAAGFAIETALADLERGGKRVLYPSDFTRGELAIPINGLVWMGTRDFMYEQIRLRLDEGFSIIKLKVGAIDFEDELALLGYIRKHFSSREIELRLDANGAFDVTRAAEKLNRLAAFDIHSIEQPIRQGNPEEMAAICQQSPIPVALDEELIGINEMSQQQRLLQTIQPAYIIIKPSLLGGIAASQQWIELAQRLGIGWWVTSALESNIGLNAIAQWTATLNNPLPQGLGTGSLYTNNITSPLEVKNGKLRYNPASAWDLSLLNPTGE